MSGYDVQRVRVRKGRMPRRGGYWPGIALQQTRQGFIKLGSDLKPCNVLHMLLHDAICALNTSGNIRACSHLFPPLTVGLGRLPRLALGTAPPRERHFEVPQLPPPESSGSAVLRCGKQVTWNWEMGRKGGEAVHRGQRRGGQRYYYDTSELLEEKVRGGGVGASTLTEDRG